MPERATESVKTIWPHGPAYRLWAAVLMLLGLGLLAHNLGILPSGVVALTRWWPVFVLFLGGWLVLRGTFGFALPSFAVPRGAFEGASLVVDSGFAAVNFGVFAGSTQLAVGSFPARAGPALETDAARAQLTLDYRAAAPLLVGDWQAQLAKGLPWTLAARSLSGDLTLNLRDLNVVLLDAQSSLGDVDLTLPNAGLGTFQVRLNFGDLTLRVPDGAAVMLRVQAGALASGAVADPRFARSAPAEWQTAGFESAAQRLVVNVELGAGELRTA